MPKTNCERCSKPLAFIAQISSPTKEHNRCFYVYGCNTPRCTKQDWVVWRVATPMKEGGEKVQEDERVEENSAAEVQAQEADDWGQGGDDWSVPAVTETKETKAEKEAKESAYSEWGISGASDWGQEAAPEWGTDSTITTTTTTLEDILQKRYTTPAPSATKKYTQKYAILFDFVLKSSGQKRSPRRIS